jgi:hypothetical protein
MRCMTYVLMVWMTGEFWGMALFSLIPCMYVPIHQTTVPQTGTPFTLDTHETCKTPVIDVKVQEKKRLTVSMRAEHMRRQF